MIFGHYLTDVSVKMGWFSTILPNNGASLLAAVHLKVLSAIVLWLPAYRLLWLQFDYQQKLRQISTVKRFMEYRKTAILLILQQFDAN
jgi:hypothetical protein